LVFFGVPVSVNIGIFLGVSASVNIGIFGVSVSVALKNTVWVLVNIGIFWDIGIGKNNTDPPSLLKILDKTD